MPHAHKACQKKEKKIAHILDGQERKSHGMSWSFILWVNDSVCYVRGRVRDLDHDSMTSL